MNYFMSDIHGNAKAYFATKERIHFNSNDKLYILGNIFDGNSEHPEHCLMILDDIIDNDNITLILGEHEYTHVLYQKAWQEDEKEGLERLLEIMSPSGKPLMDYINNLPEETVDKYINYLVKCEVTEIVTIGERNFYLVHGAPALLSETNSVEKWQSSVVREKIDLKRSYEQEIITDPQNTVVNKSNYKDTIIICGNVASQEVFNDVSEISREHMQSGHCNYQRIAFFDNKMLLKCGCQGDLAFGLYEPTLACVAIDEEGYSVTYNYDL